VFRIYCSRWILSTSGGGASWACALGTHARTRLGLPASWADAGAAAQEGSTHGEMKRELTQVQPKLIFSLLLLLTFL
jgi:hypothetical protein